MATSDLIINGRNIDHAILAAKRRLHKKIDDENFDDEPENMLIISDGTSFGTSVYHNGSEMKYISSIKIGEIKPGGYVEATINVLFANLQITAEVETNVG